jgi:arsenical pump membrane protein
MDEAVAYSTLAITVTLAVSRPRVGLRDLRFTPGTAAIVGVVVLFFAGLLTVDDMIASARIQWRPIVALTSIMVMTGVVRDTGAFDRIAARVEAYARRTSPARAFSIVFFVSAVTPALLNNDAGIILLTPIVVSLARRLYPSRPLMTQAFAFAVFLAPGVAPFVISNPMNMIVAEVGGIGFNAYAAIMLPISIAGAALTYAILRLVFRRDLAAARATDARVEIAPPHPAERPALALLVAVFVAYPIAGALKAPIWIVSVCGAAGALAIARWHRFFSAKRTLQSVSPDILVFLWGVFLVIVGLRHVGVVDRLAAIYETAPAGSARSIGTIGGLAALGSAVVDNHPMALLNTMAIGERGGTASLLAALVGGDIGPRLLPIGSLAGLLWMDLLRRAGVTISIGKFVRLGALVVVPTLTLSLAMLWMLAR